MILYELGARSNDVHYDANLHERELVYQSLAVAAFPTVTSHWIFEISIDTLSLYYFAQQQYSVHILSLSILVSFLSILVSFLYSFFSHQEKYLSRLSLIHPNPPQPPVLLHSSELNSTSLAPSWRHDWYPRSASPVEKHAQAPIHRVPLLTKLLSIRSYRPTYLSTLPPIQNGPTILSEHGQPSKQLVLDLARDLEQCRLFTADLKRAKFYERRSFYENLDRIDREREAEDNAALDLVAANHTRIREEAEDVLRKHLIAEEERRVQKEKARKEKERLEREAAERARREQEEAARVAAEKKEMEEKKKKELEEAERTARKAEEAARQREEEKEKQKREEEARKAEQEAAKRKAEEAEAERQKQIGGGRQTEQETRLHMRYVELHQHLKKFRQWLRDQGKTNPTVKQQTGDLRRSIKKCVGQLREGKGTNKGQLQEIKSSLEKAATISEPSVDIRQFLAFPPEHIANSNDTKVPALLIYGFNILVKCLISSLLTEASLHPSHAEPIGIVAAQIFSAEPFLYRGYPMSDILWAKYRVVCPALWGFYGNEKTPEGRKAIGWWREEKDGPFISDQGHIDRMTALGAGFASLTLRNFGKTNRRNPFPNTIFWHSMHKILSIPLTEIQETHVTLLASVLRASPDRIMGFFGSAGTAMLRKAILDIPNSRERQTMAVQELRLLREFYWREKNILI